MGNRNKHEDSRGAQNPRKFYDQKRIPHLKTLSALLLITSVCVAGCAENSAILKAKDSKSFFDGAVFSGESKILGEDTTGSEQYRVFQQAATGFISVETCREEVEQKAYRYCENKGMSLKLLQERTSVPPHILGNFPRAELVFVCLPKSNTPSFEDQLYIKLTNLKKLLDNGTITKEEFDQQKQTILNQN